MADQIDDWKDIPLQSAAGSINDWKDIPLQSEQYQPDTTRAVYQGVMNNVAKPINSAFSSAIVAAGNLASKAVTPEGKQAFSNAVDYVSNSPVGVAAKEGATQIGEAYNDLNSYDANGNLSHDLPALGQNALLAANVAGAKPILEAAAPGVKAGVGAVETASKKLPGMLGDASSGVSTNTALGNIPNTAANLTRAGVTTTPELADVATHFYDNADQAGALLKPQAMQKTVADIRQKVAGSTPEEQAFGNNTVVDDYLNRLDKISNMPVSISGLDGIDAKLQKAIGAAAAANDKETVSALKTIQSGLRNASSTASPADIVNPEAFQAWRDGDTVYAAKMKSQQIDDIVKNAYNQKVPSTGIQTGLRQLAKSIDKYGNQGWTDEEVSAIRNGAKTGIVGGALSTMGGKIMSGIAGTIAGAGTGGILGAPIGLAVGEAAGFPMRAAANTLQRARATQVQRLVGDRPAIADLIAKSKIPTSTPTNAAAKPLLALPAPETVVNVDSAGRALPPLSPAGREILGSAASAPIEPTLQQIKSMNMADAKAALDNYLRRKSAPRR